jgi:hypothetical protein
MRLGIDLNERTTVVDKTGNLSNSVNCFIASGGNVFLGKGIFDDVRIYNRALERSEISQLYNLGDPDAFTNYYSFKDSATNNTMMINVNGEHENNWDTTLVTCTNFFVNKSLSFIANDTAYVNIWTNLGWPISTTGVWNSQNSTTTLQLSALSPSEISWDYPTPSVETMSLSSNYAGKMATFSVLWSSKGNLMAGASF